MRIRIPNFLEIHLDCPLEVLVERDVKGLYKKALAGEIDHFTGVSDPYETPLDADVTIDSSRESAEEGVGKVWAALGGKGFL